MVGTVVAVVVVVVVGGGGGGRRLSVVSDAMMVTTIAIVSATFALVNIVALVPVIVIAVFMCLSCAIQPNLYTFAFILFSSELQTCVGAYRVTPVEVRTVTTVVRTFSGELLKN